MDALAPFVLAEREALLQEIEEAFAGVTRKGGVSWTESDEVDNYGSEEARAIARAKDKDTSWMQLVEDPEWQGDTGIGGWNFLDPTGFRYYLPVQMVRCLRIGSDFGDLGIVGQLFLSQDRFHDHTLEKWSLLDSRQRRCVKRFLQFMAVFETLVVGEQTRWEHAFESYWKDVPDKDEPRQRASRRRKAPHSPRF